MRQWSAILFSWSSLQICLIVGEIMWHLPPRNSTNLFEGDSLTLYCIDNQTHSNVSLLKNNNLVPRFGDKPTSTYLTPENVSSQDSSFPFRPTFVFQITWTNLIKADSGNYTCFANLNNSAVYQLKVFESQVSCGFVDITRQQYFVGDELEVTCNNSYLEDPDLIPVWYLMNGSMVEGSGRGIINMLSPYYSTAMISITEADNFTTFNCNLTKNNTVLANPSQSCSVGPIPVSNYVVHIQSEEGSSISSEESVTVNCRIIPSNDDVSFRWIVHPLQMNKTSSHGSETNLTLTNFSLGTEYLLQVNITCMGELRGLKFEDEYLVEVYNLDISMPIHKTITNSIARLIIIASSASLALIALVVVIFGCNYTIVPLFTELFGTDQTNQMELNGLQRKTRGVLNTYVRGRDLKKHTHPPDETADLKATRASVTSYITGDSSFSNSRCDYDYASDDSYERPSSDYLEASSGFIQASGVGGMSPQFDANGKACFVQSHYLETSFTETQRNNDTIPNRVPTWEDEMLYDETCVSPPSHHSGDSLGEYEFPDGGMKMDDETVLKGMHINDSEEIYDDTSRCPSSQFSDDSPPEYEFPESEDSLPEYEFPDDGMTEDKQVETIRNQEGDEILYEEPPSSSLPGYSDELSPGYGHNNERMASTDEDDDLFDYENFDVTNLELT